MAPLEWDQIMKIDVNNFGDDDANNVYKMVEEYDPPEDLERAKLVQLFSVTQATMISKALELQTVEDEVVRTVENEGKAIAQKDQRIMDLEDEISALRRDMKENKRFGDGGASAKDTRYIRDEMHEMEQRIKMLEREVKEKERTVATERSNSERYITRAAEAERELAECRRELDRKEDDINDLQRQVDAQRDNAYSRREREQETEDTMAKARHRANELLDENMRLQKRNDDLEQQMDDLGAELREAKREMDKTRNEYERVRKAMETTDSKMDEYRRHNEMLQEQLSQMTEQVRTKADADDEIMIRVNERVEEWKLMLGHKEDKVLDLQEQVVRLREELALANMDWEKASVSALTSALEERDKEIESLKKELAQAAGDLALNMALMDDVRSEMNKTGVSGKGGDIQSRKIAQLQSTAQVQENQLKEAEIRAQEAETDARAKDRQLSEVLERMRQYESGEYGLAEAVMEIKEVKKESNLKDRQVEELTKHINQVEQKYNDQCDENDELRSRLGLEAMEEIDLTDYRKRMNIQRQEDRAMNKVLTKEVERLEEERIELKQQMRKLAQSLGNRAHALGLNAEDMLEIGDFIENIKEKRQAETGMAIRTEVEKDELRVRNIQLDKEVEQVEKTVERLTLENMEMKVKVQLLEEENKQLENGLKEISEAIKEQATSSGDQNAIYCPTLDKMLSAIESKAVEGKYDATVFLKAQVDNLTGRNEELRSELRNVRVEATKSKVELEQLSTKNDDLKAELKSLRDAGAGGFFQAMPMPEGISATSSDVIANLNEHLVLTMQELTLKEDLIKSMEASLEELKRKMSVIRHQNSILYKEYSEERQKWTDVERMLEKKIEDLTSLREEDKARLDEFDRLVDNLAQDESEVRRRLSELTRKITVLRVNEKALGRRYTAAVDVEKALRKENVKMKSDMIQSEASVAERLGYLQRYKDMASFKMAALQKNLDQSVSSASLEKANREYTDLTEKYRDLLEKSNALVHQTEETSGYEIECKQLRSDKEMLEKELVVEKEKLHVLEAAFDGMRQQGMVGSSVLTDNELLSIGKKITTLEMKELNERQRADHATHMYEKQKQQLRALEDRNSELETKFSELTKHHLEQQKMERSLRDELSNAVTRDVSERDRGRITELEKQEANLRNEVAQLKDIAEVAGDQARRLDAQQVSRDKEAASLRQQLADFHAQSDEKSTIGKLHRHIVQLQVSEGTAVRKLDDSRNKIIKLEAMLLRTEQKLDEKEQTIHHNRQEQRSKVIHMQRTIQDLRRKYAGSVPLRQQEKFGQQMIALQEEKKQIQEDLKQTHSERNVVEEKLESLKIQHDGLKELIHTLKDEKGAAKVTEWHSKMEDLRLEDMKQKRNIQKLKEQLKFQENMAIKHEQAMISVEEEKVRLTKEFEQREMDWEYRELELERALERMEKQQALIAGAASQFEQAVGALPDPGWPISRQLEHAVTTIKQNVKLIMDAKGESAKNKELREELEKQLKSKERDILSRDRVIADLRLRLPATADRDDAILRVENAAQATTNANKAVSMEDFESKQAVKAAQNTVYSLQARVTQKEQTIKKYQELLKQARDDIQNLNKRHDEELRLMQEKLKAKSEEAFAKFRDDAKNKIHRPQGPTPTNSQLRKLNELNDLVAEQDNAIASLRDKVDRARQEALDWKYKCEDAIRSAAEEKEGLIEDYSSQVSDLKVNLDVTTQNLAEKEQELKVTLEELRAQKDANARAPTTTMKNLVHRLKNDLVIKEKQHASLSKALTELRADLVSQAQADVKANAANNKVEINVQKAVDRATKDYQLQIEELEARLDRTTKEANKLRDKNEGFNTEIEDVKTDLIKRETQVKNLREGKARAEAEIEELERKVQRMANMQKQKKPQDGSQRELEELRRANKRLEDELKRKQQQPEKPYEEMIVPQQASDTSAAPPTGPEAVLRWEESKKWQRIVDRLKQRVKEKEGELEKLNKQNDMLKSNLDRANKDKEGLEAKLRSASVTKPAKSSSATSRAPPTHELEVVRNRNYELENENGALRDRLNKGPESVAEELRIKNKFLAEKLAELEKREVLEQASSTTLAVRSAVADRMEQHQKEIIRLSEENLQLRFDVEQARKDIPRLKDRVEDLQKYVEVLKSEKDQLSGRTSTTSLNGNIRRVGESGKSTRELEKTISLLKKVVERTQQENEQLKRAPGPVSQEQLHIIQNENTGLKAQLEELRQKMGASLSERYVTQQKSTAKVMQEHDRLRKDLIKERDTNERLMLRIRELESNAEKLDKDLHVTKSKLEIEAAKRPSLSSLDSKGWKSAVVTRMYEDKLRGLEDEIEKKNAVLRNTKQLLADASKREQELIRERNDLEQKVEVLQRFPSSSGPTPGTSAAAADSDVMRQFQLARLKIDRLEAEKKELLNELQSRDPTADIGEDFPDKLRQNERLINENVDLAMQVKAKELEITKNTAEITKLRKELENFGPEFFEEIEDLKYNYRESMAKNVQYEEELKLLSKQFGVAIPGFSDLPEDT